MTFRSAADALVLLIMFVLLAFLVVGCGAPVQLPDDAPFQGAAIHGAVHGGQQPVAGAHVYLFAANTTGYGGAGITASTSNASASLLSSADTGHSDSVGAYVLTGSDGSFSITGDYTCTPNTQVYLYALGGNPGAGTNSHAGFLAVLGNCPSADNFATATPTLFVNEVTTVAAAYAMAGFATDATHVSSSGTTLAKTGIKNAFANAANLVDVSTGTARTTTPAGNGTVPTATIYTIANTLAACVNTADQTGSNAGQPSTACTTLLSIASTLGNGNGNDATDSAGAAINIAHFPGYGVNTLYNLPNGNDAFGGGLSTQPSDFSLSLTFTGGGLQRISGTAIDAAGDVWLADRTGPGGSGGLAELSPLGAVLSPSSSEWTDASLSTPENMALDTSGNVWLSNYNGHSVSEFNSSGVFQTTASAPSNALINPGYLGFDPSGNLWVSMTSKLMKFTSSGSYTAAYTGNGLGYVDGFAIDHSGNVWLTSGSDAVSEFSSSGAAVGSSPFSPITYSPSTIAMDSSNRLWTLKSDASVTLVNSSGAVVSGTPYHTGSFLSASTEGIDGAGSDWILTSTSNFMTGVNTYNLIAISSTGTLFSTSSGYAVTSSIYGSSMAIDGSGDVWISAGAQVTEIIGIATPVVTPVVANLVSPYTAPASKP